MRLLIAFALATSFSHVAYAGPREDFTQAEEKLYTAWQNLPLMERKVLLLTAPSTGYGLYTERTSNVFKPTEKIFTYVEPVGYGWKQLPNNMFEMSFVTDLTLKAENGDTMLEKKAFLNSTLQSHTPNMEFTMDYSLSLTGAPVGKYTVEYTIHDMTSKQDSSFDQQIEIAE